MGREINLLLVSEDGIRHYTAIKSLSRLLSSKNSNTKRKQHFCMNCLQGFTQESSRDQHQVYCEDNESVRVEMPKLGSTIEFKDGQNQFRVPFIMYADFESILEPMDPVEPGSPNPNQPYTNEVNQHTPSGWCVKSKFAYGDVDNPLRLYRGKDYIETFCNYIKGEAHRLYHMFPEVPMDPLTLPVRRGVGMTPQRFFEDNSAQNELKLAKFLLIQVRQIRNRGKVTKIQPSLKCRGGTGSKLRNRSENGLKMHFLPIFH